MAKLGTTTARNLVIAVLAAGGVGSWLLLDKEREVAPTTERPALPDSYFLGMELTRFDTDGHPSLEIHAARAEHFPGDDDIRLEELEARGARDDADWTLTAGTGLLATEGNRLDASGSVELVQQEPGRQAMRLLTERLEMDADREIVRTTAPVEIRYGGSSFSGTGLWASLADEHIVIESSVKARYEP